MSYQKIFKSWYIKPLKKKKWFFYSVIPWQRKLISSINHPLDLFRKTLQGIPAINTCSENHLGFQVFVVAVLLLCVSNHFAPVTNKITKRSLCKLIKSASSFPLIVYIYNKYVILFSLKHGSSEALLPQNTTQTLYWAYKALQSVWVFYVVILILFPVLKFHLWAISMDNFFGKSARIGKDSYKQS